MTNNFELYKEYITSEFKQSVLEEGDTYFIIELIRRGKDHPDKPAANYHFKNYYIRRPEDLDKYAEEIVGICNLLGLRAYASVNYKSFRQVTLNTITELAHRVSYNDYNKSYAVFDSCSSKYCNPKINAGLWTLIIVMRIIVRFKMLRILSIKHVDRWGIKYYINFLQNQVYIW